MIYFSINTRVLHTTELNYQYGGTMVQKKPLNNSQSSICNPEDGKIFTGLKPLFFGWKSPFLVENLCFFGWKRPFFEVTDGTTEFLMQYWPKNCNILLKNMYLVAKLFKTSILAVVRIIHCMISFISFSLNYNWVNTNKNVLNLGHWNSYFAF
jgi:hypothetical protein